MVEDVDADKRSRFHESPRQFDIIAAWRHISARMIVRQNDARRVGEDGEFHYLTRVNQRCRHGADGDGVRTDGTVPGVEGQHDEVLPIQAAQERRQMARNGFGAIEDGFGLRLFRRRLRGPLTDQLEPVGLEVE